MNDKKIEEMVDKLLENHLTETAPVGGEDDGALKFVFKLPEEGSFTADFLDGTSVTVDVDPEDESSGNFAFIGKDNGKIFQSWSSKPSQDDAYDVLQRVKFQGSK